MLLADLEVILEPLSVTFDIELPPVRIAYGYTLDTDTFEIGELQDVDGVLVRANFHKQSRVHRLDLAGYVLRAILEHTTKGRARFEPKRWLHDGFCTWWVTRELANENDHYQEQLVARAVVAKGYLEVSFAEALNSWTLQRERLGEPIAVATAYTILKTIEAEQGSDAVIELAKAVLGRVPPDDFREFFYERTHPMDEEYFDVTGARWESLAPSWEQWLSQARDEEGVRRLIDSVPRATATLEVRDKEGSVRELRATFVVATFDEKPQHCSILHKKLTAFDSEIEAKSLLRDESNCKEDPTLSIVGRYGPGERVFVALEAESVSLAAPIRLLARRVVVQ